MLTLWYVLLTLKQSGLCGLDAVVMDFNDKDLLCDARSEL